MTLTPFSNAWKSLAALRTGQRISLLTMIFLVIYGLCFWYFVAPGLAQLQADQAQQQSLQKTLSAKQRRLQTLVDRQAHVATIPAPALHPLSASDWLKLLQSTASLSQLHLESIKPNATEPVTQGHNAMALQLKAQGSFVSILQFLTQLRQSLASLTTSKIAIQSDDPDRSGLLHFSVELGQNHDARTLPAH